MVKEQQLNFQAFGVTVGIRVDNGHYLSHLAARLENILPNSFELIEENNPDHLFLIKRKENGDYQLFKDKKNVANSSSEAEFYGFVESELRLTIAEFAVSKVFLHAGVVAWKGKAIIIPGSSFSGKTTLVAALIKKGALYYSDEYAVLDENGNVHPFPKMLSLRGIIDDFTQVDYTAESLGGEVGLEPIPVGMILLTEYDAAFEGTQNNLEKFEPELLNEGQAILEIIAQTIPIRNNPAFVLQVLYKLVNRAIIARSKRGEAEKFSNLVLDFVEKKFIEL